jgi:DNA adenine methylase
MSQDMLDLLDGMVDETEEEEIREHSLCKSPFNYPGNKTRALEHLLKYIPNRDTYVEPFGGSGALLLARRPSKLEVYNDRFGGVVDFYRCLKDKKLFEQLSEWLDLTVHSREDFVDCKNHWPEQEDIVARAGMWFYSTVYSFGGLGRNFGRAVKAGAILSGRVRDRIADFAPVHARLKNVQIENQDWAAILRDFDTPGTVFYMDPPYIDAYGGCYRHEMSKQDHQRMLESIFKLQGFVALSAYPNNLYDGFPWDNYYSWEQYVSMTGQANTETNYQTVIKDRGRVQEGLYIKEAR